MANNQPAWGELSPMADAERARKDADEWTARAERYRIEHQRRWTTDPTHFYLSALQAIVARDAVPPPFSVGETLVGDTRDFVVVDDKANRFVERLALVSREGGWEVWATGEPWQPPAARRPLAKTSLKDRIWAQQDAQLRALDLNALIPHLWPEAQGPKSDGGRWMQWRFPGDLKVNVAPDGKGFIAWDHRDAGGRVNSHGPSRGTYAGMLVQAVEGGSFPDAIRRLKQAGVLEAGFIARQPQSKPEQRTQGVQSEPFRFVYDYSRPYQPVCDYLVQQRGIPESVVKAAWDQGQIQKGYGPVNSHYILFPCRDWSQADATPHGPKPTGALKRWVEATPPENPEYVKMAMAGTDKKAGWWQFSKGNEPKEIIVITEQPIDALSVMAAAAILGRQGDIAVLGFGGQGGITEKLLATGKHLIIATDHDPAGLGYVQEVEKLTPRIPTVQSTTRCLPQVGKDWNDWWREDRSGAAQALKVALDKVQGKEPNPFEQRQRHSDLKR